MKNDKYASRVLDLRRLQSNTNNAVCISESPVPLIVYDYMSSSEVKIILHRQRIYKNLLKTLSQENDEENSISMFICSFQNHLRTIGTIFKQIYLDDRMFLYRSFWFRGFSNKFSDRAIHFTNYVRSVHLNYGSDELSATNMVTKI